MPFKTTAILTAAVMAALGLVLLWAPDSILDDSFDLSDDYPHIMARRMSIFMLIYAFLLFRLHDVPAGKVRNTLCHGSIILMFSLGALAAYEMAVGHAAGNFMRIGLANFAMGFLFVWSCISERRRG